MQNINLNMIPGGVMPVINLTQFDEGREFAIKVMNGSAAADLTGATVTISGRKKDDTAFSYGATDYVKGNPVVSVSGNTVTIRNTQQMAILAGDVLATLTITKSASEVSTLNFTITVQQNPIDGVDVSETEVPGVVALAEEQVDEAEAWAKGTKGGNPVTSDDPQYNNNAKYWSDRAAQYSTGALRYVGSVAFANIPTTGMSNGDLYNITNDFTTDNRFIEGSGIACKAGTDIAWVSSVSKWDLPVVISVPPSVTVDSSMSTTSTNPLQNKVITNALAAGRISFGVDSQGNFGYKKDGADTVYPFKDGVKFNRMQIKTGIQNDPNNALVIDLWTDTRIGPYIPGNETLLFAFQGYQTSNGIGTAGYGPAIVDDMSVCEITNISNVAFQMAVNIKAPTTQNGLKVTFNPETPGGTFTPTFYILVLFYKS